MFKNLTLLLVVGQHGSVISTRSDALSAGQSAHVHDGGGLQVPGGVNYSVGNHQSEKIVK